MPHLPRKGSPEAEVDESSEDLADRLNELAASRSARLQQIGDLTTEIDREKYYIAQYISRAHDDRVHAQSVYCRQLFQRVARENISALIASWAAYIVILGGGVLVLSGSLESGIVEVLIGGLVRAVAHLFDRRAERASIAADDAYLQLTELIEEPARFERAMLAIERMEKGPEKQSTLSKLALNAHRNKAEPSAKRRPLKS